MTTKADDPRITTTDGAPPAPGLEDAPAPQPQKANGQNAAYWVLTKEERAKGFVRPLRDTYVHSGRRPKHPLRNLSPDERERHAGFGYVAYEAYPESAAPLAGRFWTEADLKSGCGAVTRMSREIAETYARDPAFYGSTFCVGCRAHLPVEEFVWDGTTEGVGS